ncbi:hypothetical protein ACFIQF_02705 [Comamonas sp. J-3]|jgi:hypothetical protein|uniref:hypothetical protein n=1 Tax=Comamonas trifloxystrobinivorans TaxID=3350256 RepID=UPI0037276CE2
MPDNQALGSFPAKHIFERNNWYFAYRMSDKGEKWQQPAAICRHYRCPLAQNWWGLTDVAQRSAHAAAFRVPG